MGCDWSPTGEEFVSGSYDRTVRLWNRDAGKSRDVYHTKRMQRYVPSKPHLLFLAVADAFSVFDVTYTPTADFVLTASDDGNVRIWKSNASAKLGPVSGKERAAIEYRQKLVEKWGAAGDVRSVHERRHVPGSIHNAVKLKREMTEAAKVKEERRRKHTREGREKPKAERKSESHRPGKGDMARADQSRGHDSRAEVVSWLLALYVYMCMMGYGYHAG